MMNTEYVCSDGTVCFLDPEDHELVDYYTTYAAQIGTNTYIRAFPPGKSQKQTIYLHQLLMGRAPGTMVIDHINRNGLDNRKENLRFITRGANRVNSGKFKSSKSTSNFKGVDKMRQKNKYRARVHYNGVEIHLGLSDTEKQCAIWVDIALTILYGDTWKNFGNRRYDLDDVNQVIYKINQSFEKIGLSRIPVRENERQLAMV